MTVNPVKIAELIEMPINSQTTTHLKMAKDSATTMRLKIHVI